MPDQAQFVSFLSDFGRADEFVGVCHAVMLERAPGLRIVDVTHDVPPFDVRAGALALVRAVQYLPAGVVLAVVDPGVGTARRMLAVEVASGFLVGPDNGLLAPAVTMLGGPTRVVSLTNPEYQMAAPGPTFAARDVMAPAAGYLAAGVELTELGEPVDPSGLVPGLMPLPQLRDGALDGEVLWVDRYGNCQLNLAPEDLEGLDAGAGDVVQLRWRDQVRRVRRVGAYAEARPSELVLVVDSYGMLALALDRASAAQELGLHAGSAVRLVTPDADADADVAPRPIALQRREPGSQQP